MFDCLLPSRDIFSEMLPMIRVFVVALFIVFSCQEEMAWLFSIRWSDGAIVYKPGYCLH